MSEKSLVSGAFSIGDYSESEIYAMLSVVIACNDEPKTPKSGPGWGQRDYDLYNHLAEQSRRAKSMNLLYDPYGVGVDLD